MYQAQHSRSQQLPLLSASGTHCFSFRVTGVMMPKFAKFKAIEERVRISPKHLGIGIGTVPSAKARC